MRTRVDQEPNQPQQHTIRSKKRMIRYRPSEMLAENFPAMHLVRSSWFARSLANITFYLLLMFIIAAIFVPWQQTSRCEGIVSARNPNERRQVVLSNAKGVIKWQKENLQEGSLVEQNDTLMVLETLAKDQLELVRLQEKQVRDKIVFLESSCHGGFDGMCPWAGRGGVRGIQMKNHRLGGGCTPIHPAPYASTCVRVCSCLCVTECAHEQ